MIPFLLGLAAGLVVGVLLGLIVSLVWMIVLGGPCGPGQHDAVKEWLATLPEEG